MAQETTLKILRNNKKAEITHITGRLMFQIMVFDGKDWLTEIKNAL